MTPVVLEVVEGGPATVQDGGRPGAMHHGVPPGGALVPELLAAANLRAGNRWDAPAIEAFGAMTLVPRGAPLLVATEEKAWLAPEGERVVLPRPGQATVRYLAVRGGIRVPEVLGGRGTLRVAGFGGFEGRLLRKGDRLPCVDDAPELPARELPFVDFARPIRVIVGPDLARFQPGALDALLAGELHVSPESDRTGLRLRGPALPRSDDDRPGPMPMIGGAIQVPSAGAPIVLGPDHPTTGGYPVLATVIRADQGSLWGRRPGAPVRFERVELAAAREAWIREQGWRRGG